MAEVISEALEGLLRGSLRFASLRFSSLLFSSLIFSSLLVCFSYVFHMLLVYISDTEIGLVDRFQIFGCLNSLMVFCWSPGLLSRAG